MVSVGSTSTVPGVMCDACSHGRALVSFSRSTDINFVIAEPSNINGGAYVSVTVFCCTA